MTYSLIHCSQNNKSDLAIKTENLEYLKKRLEDNIKVIQDQQATLEKILQDKTNTIKEIKKEKLNHKLEIINLKEKMFNKTKADLKKELDETKNAIINANEEKK